MTDGPRPERADASRDPFGLWALVRMLYRRWGLIFGVGAAFAAAAFAATMVAPRDYRATSLVMVNARQERVVAASEDVLSPAAPDSAVVDSEIEVIKSPELIARLVDALSLTEDPAWNDRLRAKGPLAQILDPIKAALKPPAPGQSARDDVADKLAEAIEARRRGLSYVIEITARAGTALEAQKIANTMADLYLQSQVEAREETARRANSWLTDRLDTLREEVQQKDAAVQAYRAETGLLSSEGQSLTEQQISNVQNSVLQAQADLAEKEARYRQLQQLIRAGSSPASIADALNSSVIRDLRTREADIARRQSDVESRYLGNHPSVLSIRSERADIQRQIQEEIQRISTNLGNEVGVARARLETMRGSLTNARGELAGANSAEVRLRELEREAAAARGVYEGYLQRLQQIADQERLHTTVSRLISHARAPETPFFPNMRIALAIAAAAGLLFGFGAGLIAEALDHTINTTDDLEQRVGMPAIASIPALREGALRSLPPMDRNPARYLVEKPMSAFAESIRVLRTAVVYSQLDRDKRVVAITSALPAEGKTTMSICLARIAAMSGQSVIVVDCDLRRRSLNAFLEREPRQGLLQVLSREASWRDVVTQDPQSHADVLPLAAAAFNPRDVFGLQETRDLVQELAEVYDLVILDCPPMLAVAETRVVVTLADFVVVVAQWGKSATHAVRTTIEQTLQAGAPVLGVALNRVDTNAPGRSSYSDTLYYYQAQKHYYSS
ncbi:MAG: AAA family ATPase [Hyphomonadaceae bacterium]|nr:AAA family ATPase [Hyphomonadaceae bacterium]